VVEQRDVGAPGVALPLLRLGMPTPLTADGEERGRTEIDLLARLDLPPEPLRTGSRIGRMRCGTPGSTPSSRSTRRCRRRPRRCCAGTTRLAQRFQAEPLRLEAILQRVDVDEEDRLEIRSVRLALLSSLAERRLTRKVRSWGCRSGSR